MFRFLQLRDKTLIYRESSLLKIRLTDENGDEIPGVDRLVEEIEDFELKTGLLLAACMISIKDGSSLKKS